MTGPALLAETVAYTQIRRLQAQYADILNCRRWASMADIMEPACPVSIEGFGDPMVFTGPQETAGFLSTSIDGFNFFQFIILNTVIDIDADAGTAGARMHIYEPRQMAADGQRFDGWGVYHDRFRRDGDGRWWYAERRYQDCTPSGQGGTPSAHETLSNLQIPLADL